MPIKITCKCGQGFVAKERLAGKTLKCPKCGTRVKIPQPKPSAEPTQAAQRQPTVPGATEAAPKPRQPVPKAVQKPAPQPAQRAAKPKQAAATRQQAAPTPAQQPSTPAPLVDELDDLLAEAGLDGPAPGQVCPSCGAAMSPGAILCVACGYNQQLGRQLQTERAAEGAEGAALGGGGPARKGRAKGAMNLVGVGLALMYWAFVVFVASLAIMAGCAFAGGTAGSGVVAVGLVGAGVGAIAAALMVIVGQFLCLAVPRETGAKGLIIAAIVLEFCAVLSPFLIAQALVAELQGSLSPQYAALVPALLTMVLALAAQITFLLFLRQLADYLRRSDLSDKVQTILLFYVVQIVLPFVMIPVAFVLALLPPIVAGLFGIALGLGMLGFAIYVLVQYLTLLHGLSKATRGRGRR